ncbi:hypothetical protein EO244_07670 [Ancylomarina salipaludis]|uniref:Uncharacterized protein n=1 Tax=Ancylomarina salipaludis TaxID=2501299 RepID=A0A4V1N090_9BACT|nr:hypothetical protein [Ancylomarina salipaludis]RXQ95732.1 hypothetical protein EO244_07670 [Ancylomarina salipaludis]
MTNKIAHTFHIPVMGTGYTVNTPLHVAQYGISSVISIVDDMLLENLREFYSKQYSLPFLPISEKTFDCRAQRITAYLNLMDKMVKNKFEEVKESFLEKGKEFEKYMDLLPDVSSLKKEIQNKLNNNPIVKDIKNWLNDNLPMGTIDVNIMTKVDKANSFEGEKLPSEYNDAHAALRGFANSTLESSLVLSAGMNPRLYGYLEQFDDFFPTEEGYIKKKIVLKVSDYRSALIQGKFLAKKGIWVSEYRIESGLNCGGHAFATEGFLMGPILEEFKANRSDLIADTSELLFSALQSKKRPIPQGDLELKITAQGGVGTADEHEFLLDYYGIDSVGWGSPFLLVPEVCDVDEKTFKTLAEAREDDLYLSHSSPLGVRFNNLKGNTRDEGKIEMIKAGKPGSICTKRLLVANTEYTDEPICTASRQYQNLKIKDLKSQNLSKEQYDSEIIKMSQKSCLCKGLSASSYIVNKLDTTADGDGVSICPGPNMAYFSEKASFKQMVDHIYGRLNLIKRSDRPNMFAKELSIYINYLKEQIAELKDPDKKSLRNLEKFKSNLLAGIEYYNSLSEKIKDQFAQFKVLIQDDITKLETELKQIKFPS